MNSLETTFAQLEAVRDAAGDPGAAYLIRSRLRRALLGCARAIAELQGFDKPVLPGQWVASPAAPSPVVEVAALCRRIHQNSEHLCQPSESFDIRWQQGWVTLKEDLESLQAALGQLADADARAPAR